MDEKERERIRRLRQKEKRQRKRKKNFLIFISAILLFVAVFLITVKLVNPDFDFSSLVPKQQIQQVVKYVNEDVLGKTTTAPETEPASQESTTAQPVTKSVDYDYTEFSDFAFDTSLQGNQIGNLVNKTGGAVTYSSSYIYYSVAGEGIYRFEPVEEKNSKLQTGDYHFKYLNVLGDYLYAVNTDTGELKKMPVAGGDMVTVSDDIAFAYLYNDKIYFIGTDNSVGYINTSDFGKTVLYSGQADKEIYFAGISLSRIFFVTHDKVANYNEYITVSVTDSTDRAYFREDTQGDSIINLQLEGGFMYYYQKQDDGTFNLCRQKFGSEQIVTLAEDCVLTDYPVIYANRLYYSVLDETKVKAKEINMNSMDTKTMVSISSCDGTGTLAVGYGYQYVFLIGSKTYGADTVYKCSCIYTSSSGDNTLTFKDGKLKY